MFLPFGAVSGASFLLTGPRRSAERDGVDIDFDASDLNAGVLFDFIGHLIGDGAADGGDIHAAVHNNVQVDGDAGILVGGHFHALGHGLPPEQMDQAVCLGAHRHALDAEAAGCDRTGDLGEHIVADDEIAFFHLDLHSGALPFRAAERRTLSHRNTILFYSIPGKNTSRNLDISAGALPRLLRIWESNTAIQDTFLMV